MQLVKTISCPKCGRKYYEDINSCDCGYQFFPHVASLWDRFCSKFIDSCITLVPLFLIVGLSESFPILILFAIVTSIFALWYNLFADGLKNGGSYGKRLMKILVVDASTGSPCTYGKSFIRNIFLSLSFFDVAFMLGRMHQRLGDKMANTIVIKVGLT